MGEYRRRPERGAPRGPVLLVCEKCESRLAKEGRFRQAGQLRDSLAACQAMASQSASGLRVLPVSCLDVCPRGAMAVAVGALGGRGPAQTMVLQSSGELEALCEQMMTPAKPPVCEAGSGEIEETLA